jgi:hypothetical protein
MNIPEILINVFLLIPMLIALLILTRSMCGLPVFTERDWVFPMGHPLEKLFSIYLWLGFSMLWFAVVLIGVVDGYVLFPFGLTAFLGSIFLTALMVWRVAPKWLR